MVVGIIVRLEVERKMLIRLRISYSCERKEQL